MKKEHKIEMTDQVKLAVRILLEKISRQLPGETSIGSIIIKNGEITVKE